MNFDDFKKAVHANGLTTSIAELEKLEQYVMLLRSANNLVNLISRRDVDNVWRQVLESLMPMFVFRFNDGFCLDLGTGGGLPGVPLAILNPTMKLVLMDSIQKKSKALLEIITTMKLENAEVVCMRAEEDVALRRFHGHFDYVVVRAVGPLKDLVRWAKPLLSTPTSRAASAIDPGMPLPRGAIIAYKGGEIEQEIKDLTIKHRPASIQTFPMTLREVDPEEIVDKKLVVVQP